MVTQAIGGALRVAGTITSVLAALREIEKARKDCESLAKAGLRVQADRLGRELDRRERALKASLSREITRRNKARSRARRQSRTSNGRFI